MICMARTLGAPETVPAGKHDTSASRRSRPSASWPFDHRHQVHDVRVALERHVGRHAHGAVVADPADVVAAEIDEHHVLRLFLLVALELLGQPHILFLGLAARPRAGDRMGDGVTAFDPDQHLRRRTDDGAIAHADEEHVRRRVDVPQRAIHGEGVDADLGFEPLRQHDLVDVAGGDVLLGLLDDRFVGLLRDGSTTSFSGVSAGRPLQRQRPFEFALEEVDLGAGKLVERLQVFVAGDAGIGDQQDAVLHVIEGQHRVEQHEAGIVTLGIGGAAGAGRGRLEPGGGVVAQVADGAAGEARQAGHERRLEAVHQLAQRVDERLARPCW